MLFGHAIFPSPSMSKISLLASESGFLNTFTQKVPFYLVDNWLTPWFFSLLGKTPIAIDRFYVAPKFLKKPGSVDKLVSYLIHALFATLRSLGVCT